MLEELFVSFKGDLTSNSSMLLSDDILLEESGLDGFSLAGFVILSLNSKEILRF